jgi:hypothetical protein
MLDNDCLVNFCLPTNLVTGTVEREFASSRPKLPVNRYGSDGFRPSRITHQVLLQDKFSVNREDLGLRSIV